MVADRHDQVRTEFLHAFEQAGAFRPRRAAMQILGGEIGLARADVREDRIAEGNEARFVFLDALLVETIHLQQKDAHARRAHGLAQHAGKAPEQFGKGRHRLDDVRHAGHGGFKVHVRGRQDFLRDAAQRRAGGIDEDRHGHTGAERHRELRLDAQIGERGVQQIP